jgi:hypothetical protein
VEFAPFAIGGRYSPAPQSDCCYACDANALSLSVTTSA